MPKTSPETIRTLAKTIDGLRDTFASTLTDIGATTIAPGDFPEADDLSTAVTNGATSLAAEVTNINTALTHIVTNLTTNAQLYADAEEHNEALSRALGGLIDQVNGAFEPDSTD